MTETLMFYNKYCVLFQLFISFVYCFVLKTCEIKSSNKMDKFHISYQDYFDYFEKMDVKDNNEMSYNFLLKVFKKINIRSFRVKQFKEELKKYDSDLYDDLYYIYFHPELKIIRKMYCIELYRRRRRKLLLINYKLWKKTTKECNDDEEKHTNDFIQFYNSIIKPNLSQIK